MAGIVPNIGELDCVDVLRSAWNGEACQLHLFQNDYTPDDDTDVGDLTEADFDDYASQDCNDWSSPITDIAGKAFTIEQVHQWVLSSPPSTGNTIYGYYFTRADGTLVFAERFTSSAPMTSSGDQITLTPTFRGFTA